MTAVPTVTVPMPVVFLDLRPPQLFVFGGGDLMDAIVDATRARGWDAIPCRPGDVTDGWALAIDACEQALAIIVAHGDGLDRAILERLVATGVRHIGVACTVKRMTALLDHAPTDPRIRMMAIELGDPPRAIAEALLAEAGGAVDPPSAGPRGRG
jgi:xanthine/CO dehydrogenase XdhC/CoxF family maturation factor